MSSCLLSVSLLSLLDRFGSRFFAFLSVAMRCSRRPLPTQDVLHRLAAVGMRALFFETRSKVRKGVPPAR